MKKIILFVIFLLSFKFCQAQSLSSSLSGRILLDVEREGQAWYVYPPNLKRYYLGRPADAFEIMRSLGLGISELDFQKIASDGMEIDGDLELSKKLAGRIILQVERQGQAWYINPLTYKKHYLGRPDDAFNLMRQLGLGISIKNLALIHKNTLDESIDQYSSYQFKRVASTNEGDFTLDIVEINLDNPRLKIITDTANSNNHFGPAKSLADYVVKHRAFAAINGTYFDTSRAKLNYYFFPVYNTVLKTMINDDQLKYPTTGPLMVFDQSNNFYYFKDSRDFRSVEHFEKEQGVKIQAAIGNKPRLVEEGKNLLIDWELDSSQRDVKALRNAIAFKSVPNSKGKIFLVVARRSTVVDLAEALKSLGVDYAINLDGGYSSALFYHDEYMIGPGRNIPNAILFTYD